LPAHYNFGKDGAKRTNTFHEDPHNVVWFVVLKRRHTAFSLRF